MHALTRLTLRDELDILQRALTIDVIDCDAKGSVRKLVEVWKKQNPHIVTRWDAFLTLLHTNTTIEYTMFFIAIRELTGLLK